MKLIIFDLDQTLIDLIEVHDEAVLRMFKETFGVEARITEIDYAGRSLMDSFNVLAGMKGVPQNVIEAKKPHLMQTYERIFAEIVPEDASRHVLPGVRPLLEGLSRTGELLMLYTGDSPGIVRAVFKATGLGKYFKACFYGTEVKVRAEMVKKAIEKAQEMTGKQFESKDVVVIGDSVRDVECGKAFGALTIALTTGIHTEAQLRERNPDFLFKDLGHYEEVMKAIGAV